MQEKLLTPEDLADRWNINEATLGQWRWNGRGPRYIKMGKGIRYRLSEVEWFEEKNTCRNTSEYGGVRF